MPTFRANTAVDPSQISGAFDSIAKAFAPPTPQEVYAGAKAQETQQRISQIAEIFDYAKNPGLDQGRLDRLAGVAGAYAPSSSLTAVGMNNATTLRTNAADNARALQQTGLQQQGETTRTMLAPVGEGATRFVPPSIASAFGVPAQQVGVVKANEGQVAALPGGGTVEGRAKPMTEAEAKGTAFGRLPEEQQLDAAYGSTPVETIVRNGMPEIAARRRAIGATPAPDAAKAQVANYATAEGRKGTARLDAGRWVDTQTNEVLPAGVTTYGATLQGSKNDTGLGQTVTNNIEERLSDVANVVNTVKAYRALIDRDPGAIGILGAVRGVAQDAAATMREAGALLGPKVQQFEQDIVSGRVDPEIAAQFRTLVGSGYNPNIPNAKLYELLLASQVAKMMDPSGRISNDRMKQVMEGLGGGGLLSNVDKTKANLDGILGLAESQRKLYEPVAPAAAALGRASEGMPAQPMSGDATFVRGPDGKLQRAPVRRRYNPETGALE